jgi:hypothetical protein
MVNTFIAARDQACPAAKVSISAEAMPATRNLLLQRIVFSFHYIFLLGRGYAF